MRWRTTLGSTMCRSRSSQRSALKNLWWVLLFALPARASGELPANRWVEIKKDMTGARRGSAIRYVRDAQAFFLWGFMDADPELLQEQPLMEVPEYDMVEFDPTVGRWRNHLPKEWEAEWRRKLPLAYTPRTYSAITTGSERTLLRGPTDELEGVPRPDLNIVFDQVTYDPSRRALIYFTGGLTGAYFVSTRRWSDLSPAHSPPPVLGGSLAYDPANNEVVLFGGGHVAERGPNGKVIGYTGTWVYENNDWHRLPLHLEPPPRMNTRLVCDTKNQVLVLFGGDGQSQYLADTWIFDLRTRTWHASKSPGGPPPRAGHFTVFDPETGWVIIGGGYNRDDLTDMWAYDAAKDRWRRLAGEVPTGFYITADIAPEKRLILLVTNTRNPADTMTCNILYPVRTTYGYRIDKETILAPEAPLQTQQPMAKRPPDEGPAGMSTALQPAQAARLSELPVNQWVHLRDRGRSAPVRTWGSATIDTDRSRILYWGGGHCGYEGNDVDSYDVEEHSWRSLGVSEHPEHLWNHGVRLAGVTFQGGPWTEHGRRIYAYDPVSRKLIVVRTIRLTTGYDPEPLRPFPADREAAADALLNPPSSYAKYTTWSFDPDNGQWELLGGAPLGLDTLVTTRRGVMGVNVHWPSRLNDAGYLLPWRASQPPLDTAIYLFDASEKRWARLGESQTSPQNLYEMTSLAYDSKRDRVILHGGGENRDELWTFDLAMRRWNNMQPKVVAPAGGASPRCAREAAYIPSEDVVLTYGRVSDDPDAPALYAYELSENAWRRVDIPAPSGVDLRETGQNRVMVYDPKHDLVLLVLGTGGDTGKALVYALRYRHATAKLGAGRGK